MAMAAMHLATEDAQSMAVLPPLSVVSSADEINHRIANSLQLLSAMVSIEARTIKDDAARAALDMTQRRIGAIASVHRQLYRMHEAAMMDLGDYLTELGRDLEMGCADAGAGRRVLVQAMPVAVPFEAATALGIIVSELVTNACKYAYAPGVPGDVLVDLRVLRRGGYRLVVEDHGVGAFDAAPGMGLGRRLVEMIAARLGASVAWEEACPGTRVVLTVANR